MSSVKIQKSVEKIKIENKKNNFEKKEEQNDDNTKIKVKEINLLAALEELKKLEKQNDKSY